MIDPGAVSREVVKESFEGGLEVGVGAFEECWVLSVEVLFGEVDSFSVH